MSQEPPAVRMNDELGGILTFKLKVKANVTTRAETAPLLVVSATAN